MSNQLRQNEPAAARVGRAGVSGPHSLGAVVAGDTRDDATLSDASAALARPVRA